MRRLRKVGLFGSATLAALGIVATQAWAAPVSINFESYNLGNINGQQGWSKTGPYDVEVVNVANFANAAKFRFGTKALRISDAVTSGSFGDQAFSPAIASAAGEGTALKHFRASFSIGSTQATQQAGMHVSVSPDNGQGARMSYLRFEDQTDGINVYFDDVTDSGPAPMVATFNESLIATLSRTKPHTVAFDITFKPGPHNDQVKISIDGALKKRGTTWEDYYRYDPEQAGSSNVVPTTSKMLFRESGTPTVTDAGKGFLIDGLRMNSSGN